jgi:hypothetical protein
MRRILSFLAMMAVAMTFISCGDDSPSEPAGPASVAGKVTFVNTGSWPASGDVQVSIYSVLPADLVPDGPPDAYTNPIAVGSSDYTFSLTGLEEGSYAAIYVSWRNPSVPGSATLLGMYWTYVDSVGVAWNGSKMAPKAPGPTALNLAGPNVHRNGLDLVADLALAP